MLNVVANTADQKPSAFVDGEIAEVIDAFFDAFTQNTGSVATQK